MSQTAENVLVGGDGFVMVGPLTATAPTGPTTTITALETAGFVEVGYISTEGVTEANSRTSTPVRAWQRNATVRTVTTEGSSTYQFTMIETNEAAIELYYGSTVGSDGSIVRQDGAASPRRSFVIGVIDGDERILHYIPDGQVTERGDVTYVNNNATGRPVTIAANDNSGIGGSVKSWFSQLAA